MEEIRKNHPTNYWGDTPESEFYAQQGIKSTKSYFSSPTTGLSLFTRSWVPSSSSSQQIPVPWRGIVFMVHGYGNDTGWTFQATPIYLARHGFACYALDLPGHGRSEGLRGFVPSIDDVVSDCVAWFDSVRKTTMTMKLPCFLYGESMGGAICLLIHLRLLKLQLNLNLKSDNLDKKNNEGIGSGSGSDFDFEGAVLIAPMCKISEKVKPRWPIPQVLSFLGRFLPTLPIVPTADLLDKSIKVPEKKVIAAKNPMRYNGKPRLGTVIELLRVTDYLGANLGEVSLPFIVLHGSNDVVTDPAVSKALYEEARSSDKTLKIYDGMMHSLMFGEPDHNIDIIRNDILAWLTTRCSKENN